METDNKQFLTIGIIRALNDCTGSRMENPQKPTQLNPRSHPWHLVVKRTAQKDAIKDVTSNSQVKSH